MKELKIVGKRLLVSVEKRESIGKGGVILGEVKDDLLKAKVLDSGIVGIKRDDRVYFKKFGGIKFEQLVIVEEKDIYIKLS